MAGRHNAVAGFVGVAIWQFSQSSKCRSGLLGDAGGLQEGGSGLGDCIVALADSPPAEHQWVEIADEGLRWEA